MGDSIDGPVTAAAAAGEAGSADATEQNGVASESRRRAALELIESHDAVVRRTARRYSLCADDAEDAYQRSLEILLTKAPPIDAESMLRWMQVVTKREAMAVRRHRERMLGGPPPAADGVERDPLELIAAEGPGPDDSAARRERVARSGEALRALKPDELRALLMKAEGYSYTEIGTITGWSYTKINRCMAEGRKRFFEIFASIENGTRCERYSAQLSALADGEQRGADNELRRHLASCGRCRARLRAYRALPASALSVLGPVGALAQPTAIERLQGLGGKLAAAADRAREAAIGALHGGAGEGAANLAVAGGTRGAGVAGVAKILALCGATAAGSAACVAGGVVDPSAIGLGGGEPAIERPAELAPAAVEPGAAADPSGTEPASPADQTTDQFAIESSAPSGSAAPAGDDSGSFGLGPGAGSAGRSAGTGGKQFGFQ